MNTWILLRHAKSSWEEDSWDDFERPLSAKGKQVLLRQLDRLKELGFTPDRIYASPACRTAMTARMAAEKLGLDPETVRYAASFYEADAETLADFLRKKTGKSKNRIGMLVAHHPAITECVKLCSGYELDRLFTSGIVVLKKSQKGSEYTFQVDCLLNSK